MEKLMYAVWRGVDDPAGELAARLRGDLGPRLLTATPHAVTLHVEDPAGGAMRWPVDRPEVLAAMASLWVDSLDGRGPIEETIRSYGRRAAGWVVTESVPMAHVGRDWPDGERSVGISQVTLIDKRADITDEAFFGRWHGSHTPLTFEIHPALNYVRNAVARPMTADAPSVRGIVHESFELDALLDPMRFYTGEGSKERMKENRRRMNDDLAAFVDVGTIETTPMAEYLLRS